MPIPRYSTENYRDALLNLLPLGPIWNRARDGAFAALFTVLGAVYQRNNSQAADLVSDVFPATTSNFLLEWERTLGLPDSCTVGTPTQEERQQAVVAKLIDEGGSSQRYYIRLAALSGAVVTIEQFAPARAGLLRAGQPCYSAGWAFVWRISLPSTVIENFRAGRNAAGEPLRHWGNAYIECVLRKRAPAHTILLFRYEG